MNEGRLVLRQQRELGDIVGDGLQVYGTPSLLALLLVLAIPGVILNLTLLAIQVNSSDLVWVLLGTPILFVGNAILGSGAVYALDQRERGAPVAAVAALLVALGRARDLIVAAIKVAVIVGLFCVTIVGIPWGVHRLFRWYYTTQVIMIDGSDGDSALEASADLVAGRGWPTAGRVIVIALMTGIPILIISSIVAASSDEVTSGLINTALGAVAFPFLTAATLMVYYHLKLTRQEIPHYRGGEPPAAV
jgi:hypothetical protein